MSRENISQQKKPKITIPGHIKSFVIRGGRLTATQHEAYTEISASYRLSLKESIDFSAIFNTPAPLILEIGFGQGDNLLNNAQRYKENNYIGIDVYKPGIAHICQGIMNHSLTNVCFYEGDVVPFLKTSIGDAFLDGVLIFFPDPWPKRRHHQRRLIQSSFLSTLLEKLKVGGFLHIATDWDDYAHSIQSLLLQNCLLEVSKDTAKRSIFRTHLTKFEKKAIREGRTVWDFICTKKKLN